MIITVWFSMRPNSGSIMDILSMHKAFEKYVFGVVQYVVVNKIMQRVELKYFIIIIN